MFQQEAELILQMMSNIVPYLQRWQGSDDQNDHDDNFYDYYSNYDYDYNTCDNHWIEDDISSQAAFQDELDKKIHK